MNRLNDSFYREKLIIRIFINYNLYYYVVCDVNYYMVFEKYFFFYEDFLIFYWNDLKEFFFLLKYKKWKWGNRILWNWNFIMEI